MEIKCLSVTRSCRKSVDTNVGMKLLSDINSVFCDVPLSILNLNDDCLEQIFLNINLKDLFHVILAHTRFHTACRRVFVHRFKHREISISAFQSTYSEYPEVLSVLGDVISLVRITYDRFNAHENFDHRIHDAIIRHCSDTLTEATFNHIRPTMHTNHVFRCLRKLHFNQGCVGQIMSNFNKWFPELISLQFFFSQTINTKCIEQTFPKLLHFTVAHQHFTFHNLRTFLDLNPQLLTFTVYNYDRHLITQLDNYTRLHFKSLTTKFESYPCYFAFDNH